MTVRLTFSKAGMPTYDSAYIRLGKCCGSGSLLDLDLESAYED
jgi:hypothetical protein